MTMTSDKLLSSGLANRTLDNATRLTLLLGFAILTLTVQLHDGVTWHYFEQKNDKFAYIRFKQKEKYH